MTGVDQNLKRWKGEVMIAIATLALLCENDWQGPKSEEMARRGDYS